MRERIINSIKLPPKYLAFLEGIDGECEVLGGCLYGYSDLIERNETYEITEYAPDYFMIGQDGDLGYFISVKGVGDETIYSNDLGAIGSLPMRVIAQGEF